MPITVTFQLTEARFAPWGLFTDTEKPAPFVWLSDEHTVGRVSRNHLSESDIIRIRADVRSGLIIVTGLEDGPEVPPPPGPTPVAVPLNPPLVMDVAQLMHKEMAEGKRFEERLKRGYPKVDEFLDRPAHVVRKELKSAAKKGITLPFFQSCRKGELAGKERKTVIRLLTEIIQRKVAAVGATGATNRVTGQSLLSDAYFDMIEEEEEEDSAEEASPIP